MKSVVSSANERVLQPIFSTISLMNITNWGRPSTETRGMLAEIIPVRDVAFQRVTQSPVV